MTEAIRSFPGIGIDSGIVVDGLRLLQQQVFSRIEILKPVSMEHQPIKLSIIPIPKELKNASEADRIAYETGWEAYWRGDPSPRSSLQNRGYGDAAKFNFISL